MMATELWLTYHQTSRTGRPCTAQLLDTGSQKLVDLEDVLDYIFAELRHEASQYDDETGIFAGVLSNFDVDSS